MQRGKEFPKTLLFIPTILTAAIALVRSTQLPLWRDEMATFAFASLPLNELREAVSHVDLVLLPYYFAMHFVHAIPGDFIVRLPSVLAATLTVALLAKTVAKTGGPALGFWASLCLALNPLFILMSSTARPYALTTLCVVSALWSLFCYLEKQQWRCAIAFGVSFWMAVLFHPFSILALPAWLVSSWNGRRTSSVVLLTIPAIFSFLFIAIAAQEQTQQLSWLPDISVKRSFGVLINAVSYQPATGPTLLSLLLAMAILTMISIGIVSMLKEWSRGRLDTSVARLYCAAFTLAFMPWLLLIAYSLLVIPILRSAYLTASTPGIAVLVAIGVTNCNKAINKLLSTQFSRLNFTLMPVAFIVLATPAIYFAGQSQWQDDFRSLSSALKDSAKLGDDVIIQERPYERGVAAGIAHYTDDTDFFTSILTSLSQGDTKLLTPRTVAGEHPFMTVAGASADPGYRRVFLIHSGTVSISELEQVETYTSCKKASPSSVDRHFGQVSMALYECR